MRPRIAHKIVKRVQDGTALHSSYSRADVVEAFRRTGTDLDINLFQPWDDFDASEVQRIADESARALDAKALREARLEARAARIQARLDAKDERRAAARKEAAAHLIEAWDPRTNTEDAVWSGEHSESDATPDYAAMKRDDLRQICKEQRLSGYSTLKKAQLVALLLAATE